MNKKIITIGIVTVFLLLGLSSSTVLSNDYSREKSHVIRMRGRVIGAEGKSRVTIEHLTETFMVVYGKTISIIGSTAEVRAFNF